MTQQETLRRRIYAAEFAMWELHLFLDTHPDSAEAARKLQEYEDRAAQLKKEYEDAYGPLGENMKTTSRWAWVTDPWPWEKEAN